MCDCYFHKCNECDVEIPIHIRDFSYPRKDLIVWCGKHLPQEKATIFTVTRPDDFDEDEPWHHSGWQCAIRPCNGEVEPDAEDISPNTCSGYDIKVLA